MGYIMNVSTRVFVPASGVKRFFWMCGGVWMHFCGVLPVNMCVFVGFWIRFKAF